MKNRKKRAQREEVRKILKAMRKELEVQRLAQERQTTQESTLHLSDLLRRAQDSSSAG